MADHRIFSSAVFTPHLSVLPLLVLLHVAAIGLSHEGVRRSDGDTRIVGGTEVEPGSLPYMVAVYLDANGENKYHCGGAIISAHHILTAAHCVSGWNSERFTVVAGAHNLTAPEASQVTVGVAELTVHELAFWLGGTAIPVNDIALLRLKEPLVLGSGLEAVKVPVQDDDPEVAVPCTVSGWGSTQTGGELSTVLLATEVPVVEQEYCVESYGLLISPSMMCAGYPTGGQDACAGDSGGPLVCDGLVQGIVSWGEECGESQKFGVYTRVAFFSDWIEKHNYVPQLQ